MTTYFFTLAPFEMMADNPASVSFLLFKHTHVSVHTLFIRLKSVPQKRLGPPMPSFKKRFWIALMKDLTVLSEWRVQMCRLLIISFCKESSKTFTLNPKMIYVFTVLSKSIPNWTPSKCST